MSEMQRLPGTFFSNSHGFSYQSPPRNHCGQKRSVSHRLGRVECRRNASQSVYLEPWPELNR